MPGIWSRHRDEITIDRLQKVHVIGSFLLRSNFLEFSFLILYIAILFVQVRLNFLVFF